VNRPDGRPYRPRTTALRAHAWENPDTCGLVITGTLNSQAAHDHACRAGAYWYGDGTPTDPQPGWYRKAIQRGEPIWVIDDKRGMPGVYYTWATT
jgi:hypothetical protein